MYRRSAPAGFGNEPSPVVGRAKPLKRPSQARARFTVQAIYDAFVRIWRERGWKGVTTRAVALETGIAVGTLYDYFPNKHALLSGYVRHGIETLLACIDEQVVRAEGLAWRERMQRLVALTCGAGKASAPFYFPREMLELEAQIAEPKHHRRVYEELSSKWLQALQACADLPRPADAATATVLFTAVWGGWRYRLLVNPADASLERWVDDMGQICCAAFER